MRSENSLTSFSQCPRKVRQGPHILRSRRRQQHIDAQSVADFRAPVPVDVVAREREHERDAASR